MKMRKPSKEDCVGDCFKAQWLSNYLEEFTEKMVHDGRSLLSRIRLGVQIENVTDEWKKGKGRQEARWSLLCRNLPHQKGASVLSEHGADEEEVRGTDTSVLRARKLIITAGEYHLPNILQFKGQETFDAPIIHSTNFGASNLLEKPNINHVTILGAGKSSADMLYNCLKSLPPITSVHWIIRPDGTGPGFFAPIDMKTPYNNGVEAAQTRALSLLQPSAFHQEGWWVWFLHRTWVGIWLVGQIFGFIDKEAKGRAGYTTRPEAAKRNFDKLEYTPG
jgi:dimethylaniline monooxygenase (N-oxide forming)